MKYTDSDSRFGDFCSKDTQAYFCYNCWYALAESSLCFDCSILAFPSRFAFGESGSSATARSLERAASKNPFSSYR